MIKQEQKGKGNDEVGQKGKGNDEAGKERGRK